MVSWDDHDDFPREDESLHAERDRDALESLDRREAEDEWPE